MVKYCKDAVIMGRILCLLLIFMWTAVPAEAQISGPLSAGEEREAWGLDLYAETGIAYNDNIFRLTEHQISLKEENDHGDLVSGRFRAMNSLSDYVLIPGLGVEFNSRSPLGGEFELTWRVRYNYYTKNTNHGFPELEIGLNNSVGKKGELRLEGDFLFGFTKKNYISDARDINRNGNISREERIYSPAIYDECEVLVEYEHEVLKDKDKKLSRLDVQPYGGCSYRKHNSTFANKDKKVTFGGLEVDIEFLNRLDLELVYEYEKVRCPGNRELFLYDETRFVTDVNVDGETAENALLITNIDRSADRHTLEINPSLKFTEDTEIFAGFRKRKAIYTSNNQLDIEHYNQKAYREEIKTGIEHDFSKAWSAETEYSRTINEDEEDGEYTQDVFMFTIKYDFY